MGLLSDPEYGSAKWVRVLRKIHGPICFICYVGALVWFVLLGHREFNNETYFSENALLPGLVTNEFNAEQAAKQFYNEFLLELEDKYMDTTAMPVSWLVGKMSQLHLEVYTHNFTLNYPYGEGQKFTGTNVYGILRAPRTASLEALVVSAPYRPLTSHEKGTAAGIALMLAFAQFARPQKYWAKDIIFLFTEHEQLGMQAWLEAYHGLNSDSETFYTGLGSFWKPGTFSKELEKTMAGLGLLSEYQKALDPGKLTGRSGSIQAAINLEIHDPKIKYIEVKVEGLNGQLPNLDLVNLVHKLCVKSGIHNSYKYSYSWVRTRNKMEEWYNSFWTMMGMVAAQVAGVPSGNHGLFHRFGIEAVTLEGRDAEDPAGRPPRVHSLSTATWHRLGVTLESILRSLNNLLERFHQSYFFYLLANTNRFLSIGQYMPSLCLLCAAMFVRALSLWVTIQQHDEEDDKQTEKPQNTRKVKTSDTESSENSDTERQETPKQENLRQRKLTKTEVTGEKKSASACQKETANKKGAKLEESRLSVVRIGANYLTVHLIGYAAMNSPDIMTRIGTKHFGLLPEASLFYGLTIISLIVTVLSPYIPQILRTGRINKEEMLLINILALTELTTTSLTVGMHNFPLGMVLASLYTPLALITGAYVRGSGRLSYTLLNLKRLLCLLLHPVSVLTLCMVWYSAHLAPEEGVWGWAARGRGAAMHATMFSAVDHMIYGNWLFTLATAVVFPTWVIFWQILTIQVEP